MGSDSRTATATSSKPRPSWRNRHLSQLSEEQLDDVRQHREASGSSLETGSGSVGEMAGIESTQTSKRSPQEEKLPRRQAGPDRSDSYPRDSYRTEPHRAGPVPTDSGRTDSGRTENSRRQRYQPQQRPSEHRERVAERGHGRQPQARDGRSNRGYREERPYNQNPERSHSRDDRLEPPRRERRNSPEEQRRNARRNGPAQVARQHSARDSADRRMPVSDRPAAKPERSPSKQAESVNKQSVFAKLSGFKLPGPVKYGLMAFAIVALVAVSLMKPIDNSSQSQLDSALTRAMIGFGLARTLNGVISVAQGTEFAVQPAGVGVNFSPGEILDPINDLVERFSWVMLLATSSIGVQKILLEVSSWTGISVLLAGAGLFFLLTRLRNSSIARMADVAGKVLLAMLLVRFLIPVGSLANDWVYKQFLQPQYEQSSAELEIASNRIREISTRQTKAEENDGSLKERAKNLYNSMTSKFDFDGMLDDYKSSAENVSEHAINLIVVFMLQTIVFPLLFLYLIYRLFRSVLLPSRSG